MKSKRMISLLLAALILLAACLPLTAFAEERSARLANPFYSGDTSGLPSLYAKKTFLENAETATYQNKTYYTLGKQLFNIVRKELDARSRSVTVQYLSKDEIYSTFAASTKVLKPLFVGATEDEISRTSTDGDYARWAVSYLDTLSMSKDAKKDGYFYYTLEFAFDYYNTDEQEAAVDRAIPKFIESLQPNGKSDYAIIKAIHDKLCKKNVYAYEALNDEKGNPTAFTAYGALITGRCVCQGYAAAFYRICKEMGFDVRFVSSNPLMGCHAWNLINLDGQYYFIDCTWDDQAMDEDVEEITPYTYFLVTYGASREYDNWLGQHKLDGNYYDNRYFDENFTANFAQENYNKKTEGILSACSVTLSETTYTYDGAAKTPAVTVTAPDGSELTETQDYKVSYADTSAIGEGTVTVNGKGTYSGKTAVRRYTILPAAVSNLKVYGQGVTALKLNWKNVPGNIAGYEVQCLADGKWTHYANTADNHAVLLRLDAAAPYTFRVRAYAGTDRRRYYGANSNEVTEYTKPGRAVITAVTAKRKAAVAEWQSAPCTGIQVQYSLNKDMSNAKSLYVKNGRERVAIRRLTAKKRYYIRLRYYVKYRNADGAVKALYGKWSAKKRVTVK